MRKLWFIVILGWYGSCVEEVPDLDPGFVKIYGAELESTGGVAMEMENGNLLLIGSTTRSRFMDVNSIGDIETFEKAASLTLTDPNGNLLLRRVFPWDTIYHDSEVSWVYNEYGVPDIFENRGGLIDIVRLLNGGYLALFQGFAVTAGAGRIPFPHLMTLDKDFNLIKIINITLLKDLNDTLRDIGKTRLFLFPDGMPGLLAENDNCLCDGDSRFGIMKLSEEGEITSIINYPDIPPGVGNQEQADDVIFDENGNIIVIATRFDSNNGIKLDSARYFKISPSDGHVLQYKTYGDSTGQHFPVKIMPYENGYIVFKRYDNNQGDPDHEIVQDKLTLSFLDNDFNKTREDLVYDIIIGSFRGAVQTDDGNLVVLILEDNARLNSGLLIKIDLSGNVLWKRQFDGEPTGLLKTRDGKLIISLNKQFNSLESKLTLIKLDQDGSF